MDAPGDTDHSTAPAEDTGTTQSAGFWAGTALAALVGAAVGVFFVLPFGLIVVEYVIFPLSLAVGAVLASLSAGWVGNRLAAGQTRTQLLSVVWVTLGAALAFAVLFLANASLRLVILGPVFYSGLLCVIILALAATIAAGRFRGRQSASNDRLLTIWLLAAAVVSIPLVIFLASLAGLTGA